ncbi:hypothetical protein J6590_001069 [Homalodisca vitripennis]|nr:hypothetical protein J6590_001069 [Homalodisca vitripennis]
MPRRQKEIHSNVTVAREICSDATVAREVYNDATPQCGKGALYSDATVARELSTLTPQWHRNATWGGSQTAAQFPIPHTTIVTESAIICRKRDMIALRLPGNCGLT